MFNLQKYQGLNNLVAMAVILFIGIGTIGITYQITATLNKTALEESQRVKDLLVAFENISSLLSEASEEAKSFFSTGQLEFYEDYQAIIDEVSEAEEEIENRESISVAEEQALTLLRDGQENIDELVQESLINHLEYGIDSESGFRSEVRDIYDLLYSTVAGGEDLVYDQKNLSNSQKIEDAAIFDKLLVSVIRMQNFEKDFVYLGSEEAVENLTTERLVFIEMLEELEGKKYLANVKSNLLVEVDDYFGRFLLLVESKNKTDQFDQTVIDEFDGIIDSTFAALVTMTAESDENASIIEDKAANLTVIFYSVLITVLVLMLITLYLIGRRLFSTMHSLETTLDERAKDFEQQEKMSNDLNNSVIELMEAADRLSRHDLTVKVPVNEDVTGSVADALNIMTKETAATITSIRETALQLDEAAKVVNSQNEKVATVSEEQKEVIKNALLSLNRSSKTMENMAILAGNCNQLSNKANDLTGSALSAVENTVDSIVEIRSIVSESEKSIKRLGERSKEVGSIIEIIKDIAARTHTLALNAGMQAVAAGEAGRGFSVVADEVQHLAETARESTEQVTSLVNRIQVESEEAMKIMNRAIDQVVDGSKRAEKAGNTMQHTRAAAVHLAGSVAKIMNYFKVQQKLNTELQEHADQLKKTTSETEKELVLQAAQTSNMFNYLKNLVSAVSVFTLPGSNKNETSLDEDDHEQRPAA